MVHMKLVDVFILIPLSVVLQLRVVSQPTVSSFEDNSCPQLEEDWRIQAQNWNQHHKCEFEYERQRLKTLEIVSHSQSEENQRLNVELENERQRIKTLENVSRSQFEENQRLNVELVNEQQRFKTLENVSHSQFEENQRLNVELENEQQSLKTLKSAFHSHCVENQRLNVELENESQLIQNSSLRRATVNLIKEIDMLGSYAQSVIKVLDEIYVLCRSYTVGKSLNSIKVFEDRNEFRLLREIFLNGTKRPDDMVYSNESKFIYIADVNDKCIWRMTTEGDHRLTKWLTSVISLHAHSLSLSNEGHLLMLRRDYRFSHLEIYSLSANLIRSIQLPRDVKNPDHVVQTSTGYYVMLHELTDALNRSMVISQVNSAGQLMNRFTPRNQFQVLNDPRKLFYDSGSNRLFVPDVNNYRVILLDSNCLNWIQVLRRRRRSGGVFYDVNGRQLLLKHGDQLGIYELI